MGFVAVMDQAMALLRQRSRQDGVHRAGNVRSAHGAAPPAARHVARLTPMLHREDSQEGTWDRDRDEVERGVDAGAVRIAS